MNEYIYELCKNIMKETDNDIKYIKIQNIINKLKETTDFYLICNININTLDKDGCFTTYKYRNIDCEDELPNVLYDVNAYRYNKVEYEAFENEKNKLKVDIELYLEEEE